MSKILLLGANGQVGFELARALAPLGDLRAATRDEVDLANPDSLNSALETKPDVVVNAAAYTAVDRAEDEQDLADSINHRALMVLGGWAKRNDALIVHYSTDYVFDGRGARPYREDDTTAPLGVYGKTKLAGEEALRASGCRHLIFRTAWVYAARGHNFLRTMLRVGGERGAVRVVNDQRGAPTTARLIADVTAHVLARRGAPQASGTYHLSAGGECTWFEFARAIFASAHAAGLIDRQVDVAPIATADYPTRARRPAYSVLDTTKLQDVFGVVPPPWGDGLEAVIAELVAQAQR